MAQHAATTPDDTPKRSNMRFYVLAIVATFALMLGAGVFMNTQEMQAASKSANGHTVPLCKNEDGKDHRVCFWDAEKQGNGEGRSFTSYNFGEFVVFNDTLEVSK